MHVPIPERDPFWLHVSLRIAGAQTWFLTIHLFVCFWFFSPIKPHPFTIALSAIDLTFWSGVGLTDFACWSIKPCILIHQTQHFILFLCVGLCLLTCCWISNAKLDFFWKHQQIPSLAVVWVLQRRPVRGYLLHVREHTVQEGGFKFVQTTTLLCVRVSLNSCCNDVTVVTTHLC